MPQKQNWYFRQGNSDKVYHLHLENVQEKWSVHSALQSDVKVGSRTYEQAKRVYDRILRGKTGKGYRIPQATITSQAANA